MSFRVLLGAALLVSTYTLVAQEHPATFVQPNTVYVGAEGKFESPPDTALIQFNIAAQDESSKGAYQKASNSAEAMRQILKANGIDPKNAELGFYSLEPQYDWRNPKRKLIAYRVSTSVTLKLKDFSKVAPLLEQFSTLEGSENQSLSYTLENMDEAKKKAVQDALQRARASAQVVAQSSARTLGELVYASVDILEPPGILAARGVADMRMMKAEAAPSPGAEFSPQKITVTAHVNALFGLK